MKNFAIFSLIVKISLTWSHQVQLNTAPPNNLINTNHTINEVEHIIALTNSSEKPTYSPNREITTEIGEKLEKLSCNLSHLPNDFRIWKGNETHELLLPIMIASGCSKNSLTLKKVDKENSTSNISADCIESEVLNWDGSIEIQSGDVLLVRIEDSDLIKSNNINKINNKTYIKHEPTISVYQVTRTGHDHCDKTEGILLDITPLKVENQEVVTLYDKDLTLGLNHLIVVSELWGNQCVRLKVIVKSDNCGENEDCSGKGLCYSNASMDGYECQCCSGFIGQHCEDKDPCYPIPCKNSGICIGISHGHEESGVQCLCPYGFSGKTCEDQTNPCTSMPCQNGATCIGNATQFKCECPAGYSGILCQHSANKCESSHCAHGICVDQENSYKCFCQPGFTGIHCEYEYNECESSPCKNGGTCIDDVGHYICRCDRGYTGKRCQIKVNLCEPNPCPEPRSCLDEGNKYTCECPKGYSGQECSIPSSNEGCTINPCLNGGTCFNNKDSFYCACKAGYTGKTCRDELVDETITDVKPINKENELEFQLPISIHFDHLHNVYVAIGTLACAFVIVILIVTICHCRVNKTYKRFISRANATWNCKRCRIVQPSTSSKSEWFNGKDKPPTMTSTRSLPSLDTTDLYYTLDFSESQSSPLIQ